jgi:hypothetical protein
MRSFFGDSRIHLAIGRAAFLVAVAARSVSSQSAPRLSVIDGIVTDSALVPLGNATVSLLGSSVAVVTRANGRFRVRDLKAGSYIVIVRRIGYEPASVRLQLTPGDTTSPSVALSRASTTLDTVAIHGERSTPAMQEFDARRKLGFGHFVTQAEIDKRNPVALSDMLNGIPSVQVSPNGTIFNVRAGSGCPFQIFVDGVKLPVGSIDNIAVPKEVAGIEIYSGAATIPLQYKTLSGSFCGVILLWTRIGS